MYSNIFPSQILGGEGSAYQIYGTCSESIEKLHVLCEKLLAQQAPIVDRYMQDQQNGEVVDPPYVVFPLCDMAALLRIVCSRPASCAW